MCVCACGAALDAVLKREDRSRVYRGLGVTACGACSPCAFCLWCADEDVVLFGPRPHLPHGGALGSKPRLVKKRLLRAPAQPHQLACATKRELREAASSPHLSGKRNQPLIVAQFIDVRHLPSVSRAAPAGRSWTRALGSSAPPCGLIQLGRTTRSHARWHVLVWHL